MPSKLAERFMHALQEAERTADVEPLVDLFAPDAELSSPASPRRQHGPDGARHFWRNYLSAFDRVHSRFTAVIEAGDRIALEWVSEGNLLGGEPLAYSGISILETERDRVRRFRMYFDTAAFFQTPGTAAAG